MNNISPEVLSTIAEMRREAAEDLTDMVFLLNIASEKIKALGGKHSYLGSDFSDLSTAIRIAKEKGEISRDYHNSEAYQLENDVKKSLEKLHSTGSLLNEQEK